MQVCLFCGAANSPGAAVCHSCSQPLSVEEDQGDNPEAEGAEEAERTEGGKDVEGEEGTSLNS